MVQVNLDEAKTNLPRLLQRVESGEEIIINKNGAPVARLVPIERAREHEKSEPELGEDVGNAWLADDFDAPLPNELTAAFEGASDEYPH